MLIAINIFSALCLIPWAYSLYGFIEWTLEHKHNGNMVKGETTLTILFFTFLHFCLLGVLGGAVYIGNFL